MKFSLAYHYLDKLESIHYNYFTWKKNTIEETKKDGRSFKGEVVKLEKAYKEYLESINNQKDEKVSPESYDFWKIAFVGLSCVVVVSLLVVLFYMIFW